MSRDLRPAGVPPQDLEVPAFWHRLGLPGLVDVHVHGMPQRLLDAVWRYFDGAGPLVGREWPITYRWPVEERLAHLRAMGVRAFPTLFYAHKPGMAEGLNDWAGAFVHQQRAGGHDDVVHSATVFPEEGAARYLERALRDGARVVKIHVQVGGFDPRDALLDPVWALLADARTPAVVHTGNGPRRGNFTGAGIFAEVLRRHPSLTAVIAHLGMPDYDEFIGLAERYQHVHLDTTMVFVDFFGGAQAQTTLARRLAPRLQALQDKVLLGTDYPNIPYPYAHQLEALTRTGLDDDWLRAVCWHNGARLLGIDSTSGVRAG
ncbi:amidohydrolase family protein [Segeticoccus rhizosphaerae]|jgi:predicted TIM-barrel fold metal-dependent hydrolase|uniref:amidohydrolase family protein n=1 Tax=Segeticoccus rhizosphaerae TaxID=1104777 RepID=UPI0010C12EAD|nr:MULTISPECIES: amidohydrolase family protein [Intrasporangiaceae]